MSQGFERYVREAEQAERMAQRAQSEAERETWSDIALLWRDLAQRRLAAGQARRPRLVWDRATSSSTA